ncbi:hypothetical protein [Streptomyces lincolnensis]|uniref:hypothetical protein n=1 Tax=Streptomyces lincolnensis TaxID=1915 RepID=UPI0008297178|nr:hypothetical protein [Streptomyces lincolnensis]QMV10443.1 hypothetical protein GJU35_35470 [Streptomyces lincolnensis]
MRERASGRGTRLGTRLAVALLLVALPIGACDSATGTGAEEEPSGSPAASTLRLTMGGSGEFSTPAHEPDATFRITVRDATYRTEATEAYGEVDRPRTRYFLLLDLRIENRGPYSASWKGFAWVGPSRERVEDPTECHRSVPRCVSLDKNYLVGESVDGIALFDVPAKGGHLDYPLAWPRYQDRPALVIELPDR